jgi:hypothetical protein
VAEAREKVAGHLESIEADEILSRSHKSPWTRRRQPAARLTYVLCGGPAVVQVNQKNK